MPKDLKATVTLDTKRAEERLKALTRAIAKVQDAVNNTAKNNAKLSKAINQNVTATNKLKKAANDVATSINKQASAQSKVTQAVKKTTAAQERSQDAVDGIIDKVKALARAYLGVMGMRAAIESADTLTGAQNQLNNLPGGSSAQTKDTLDKVYAAAVRSRGDYATMLKNVGKSMTLAPDAFQGNVDNAVLFQEIMAKAYKLSGASAAEQSSSMYQLVQALGSGILQGDELRSIREGAPLAAKQIEKFAQEVYGTTDSLKEMGSQGMLTSELVVAAILGSQDKIQESFENTQMTFGDAWNRIRNDAQKAFEPVFIQLTGMLNDFAESGGFKKIGNAFVWIADKVGSLLKGIQVAIDWVAENWDWLSYVVYTGAAIVLGVMIALKVATFLAGLAMAGAFIMANLPIIMLVIGIIALIQLIWAIATTTENVCEFIATLAYKIAYIIVGVLVIILAISLATGTAIIGAGLATVLIIIAVIALLVSLFFTYTEQIVGAVYWAGALIYNVVAGYVNYLIQFLWSMFAVPIISIIEFVQNVFNGGFNGITGMIANAVGQWISWIIEFGKVAAKVIDAIVGTDLTGMLSDLSVKVSGWGKNENAVTKDKSVPWTMERTSMTGAYAKGAAAGAGIKDSINNWGGGIKDKLAGFNLADPLQSIFNGEGLPDADALTGTGGYDPAKLLDSIDGNTGKTAGSAGKIADSMELAEEDLAYLKDVANMEWKKEFTTATIKVDMNNSGATINNQGDLDGIVTKLTTALYEELDAVAHGVYA